MSSREKPVQGDRKGAKKSVQNKKQATDKNVVPGNSRCNPMPETQGNLTPAITGQRRVYPRQIVSSRPQCLTPDSASSPAVSTGNVSSDKYVDYSQLANYHKLRPLIQFIRAHSDGISQQAVDELSVNSVKEEMRKIVFGLVYPETIQSPSTDNVNVFDTISLEKILSSDNVDNAQAGVDQDMLKPLEDFIRAHPEGISDPSVSNLAELSSSEREKAIDAIIEAIMNPPETVDLHTRMDES